MHTQVKFKNFTIDEHIFPLMDVFYQIPSMITYSSCQGDDFKTKNNPLKGHPDRGHICFNMPPNYFGRMVSSLRRMKSSSVANQWTLSDEWETETSQYRLTFWPHLIPIITNHLKVDFLPHLDKGE